MPGVEHELARGDGLPELRVRLQPAQPTERQQFRRRAEHGSSAAKTVQTGYSGKRSEQLTQAGWKGSKSHTHTSWQHLQILGLLQQVRDQSSLVGSKFLVRQGGLQATRWTSEGNDKIIAIHQHYSRVTHDLAAIVFQKCLDASVHVLRRSFVGLQCAYSPTWPQNQWQSRSEVPGKFSMT